MSSCGARCHFRVRERLRADGHKSHHLAPDRLTVLLKPGIRPKSKGGWVLLFADRAPMSPTYWKPSRYPDIEQRDEIGDQNGSALRQIFCRGVAVRPHVYCWSGQSG